MRVVVTVVFSSHIRLSKLAFVWCLLESCPAISTALCLNIYLIFSLCLFVFRNGAKADFCISSDYYFIHKNWQYGMWTMIFVKFTPRLIICEWWKNFKRWAEQWLERGIIKTSSSLYCLFLKNGPTPASFLFIFVLFNNNFTEKL